MQSSVKQVKLVRGDRGAIGELVKQIMAIMCDYGPCTGKGDGVREAAGCFCSVNVTSCCLWSQSERSNILSELHDREPWHELALPNFTPMWSTWPAPH